MRDTSLILVEGIPGTGKSTVAQQIHMQLLAARQPSRWCHEERADHPLQLFYDLGRHPSWSDYAQEAVRRWQDYVAELRRDRTIAVLDAALLQNHLRSMLIFGCASDSILDLVRRIERVIAPLNPVLIYLAADDIEQNFRDVVESRGERMLQLWIAAHDRYPFTRKAGLSGYRGFIAFLDLSASGACSPGELACFTGEYMAHADPGIEVRLEARDGGLVACVEEPTIDVERGPIGCFREVRLVPKGDHSFSVVGWPHAVEFTEGPSVEMRVSIAEEGWPAQTQVFVKR